MFSHMMVGSNDLDRSRRFYDALFEKEARADDKGRLSYGRRGAVFMVGQPIDGAPATHGNGATIGFTYDSPAGPRSPCLRSNAFGSLYLAYLRDPDGNKLCALHRPQA